VIGPADPTAPCVEYPLGSAAWWEERYRSGDVPWDTGIVPPEVVTLVGDGQLKAGWALDIGCGSGLSSRYLASQGFRVVGLDLALSALFRAAAAARQAGLPAFFCQADVTELGFLHLCASFALDVGCFHAIAPDRRPAYIASLAARLMPGAFYLLYAFSLSTEAEEGPRGIGPVDIGGFTPDFVLRWVEHGLDRETPSAWYLLERS
jgi:cyclopropane fatty-acyl-phospholipid synthase-like methyltransferase